MKEPEQSPVTPLPSWLFLLLALALLLATALMCALDFLTLYQTGVFYDKANLALLGLVTAALSVGSLIVARVFWGQRNGYL